MKKALLWISIPVVLIGIYVLILYYESICCRYTIDGVKITPSQQYYYHYTKPDGEIFSFNLIDPEESPPEVHQQVMEGFRIFCRTTEHAKQFVGGTLSCTNCHFCGGNMLGGWNGGISLAGVTQTYPQYSPRSKTTETIQGRIDNCFRRSLNGTAPPDDDPVMKNLVAYLEWISAEFKDLKPIPWLGLKPLKAIHTHTPNPTDGEKIYHAHCARCHQPTGLGTTGIPPVWGPHSFNDGAGMNTLPMLSSFVYYNMPYEGEKPMLTEEQALDVASFVIKQPRPHFEG